MATYSLPDMPYDYAALEPAITGEILELHHSKHHAAYVKGANDTLEQLEEVREKDGFTPTGLHHGNVGITTTPLVFDAWEQAYYLQYRNVRPDYVQKLWSLINWNDVSARYTAAVAAAEPAL